MKSILIVLVLGFVLSAQGNTSDPLTTVAFMQGCWGTTNEEGLKVTEDWFSRANEVMLGVSQTTENGSMVQYEFLEIRWNPATQKIGYTPFLNGRRLNTFFLKSTTVISAIFSDPENISLKELEYSLKSSTILNVRLSGKGSSGDDFDFNYDMNREDCSTRH